MLDKQMKILYCSFILLHFVQYNQGQNVGCLGQRRKKGSDFRYDYNENLDAQAYYKLHEGPTTWQAAQRICRLEGSELASPVSLGISAGMQRYIANLTGYQRVFTGYSSRYLDGYHISVKGDHLHSIVHEWADKEPYHYCEPHTALTMDQSENFHLVDMDDQFPFICYLAMKGEFKLNECGVSDVGYVFNETLNECYKLHYIPQTWENAVATCFAEGGHLVVVNSQAEADFLSILLKENKKRDLIGNTTIVASGFRVNNNTGEWHTIFDKTIEETGYTKWVEGRPSDLSIHCGYVISEEKERNSGLKEGDCNNRTAFICEMETQPVEEEEP